MASPWPEYGEALRGTDALGRPYTDEEKRFVGRVLRKYDYVRQRIIALRFGVKLSGGIGRGQDLASRADLRLVRAGWDPAKLPLVRCLCRFVWSEWTHLAAESVAARNAEERYIQEQEAQGMYRVPSAQDQAVAIEERRDGRAHAVAKLDELRAVFAAKGDTVNLLWLDFRLKGITDMREMAVASAREPSDFYDAAKRRNRVVARLAGPTAGVDKGEERGTMDEEPES